MILGLKIGLVLFLDEQRLENKKKEEKKKKRAYLLDLGL